MALSIRSVMPSEDEFPIRPAPGRIGNSSSEVPRRITRPEEEDVMPETDRVLIDPTEQEVQTALAEAVSRANGRGRLCLLDWPPADLADFLLKWRTAEGFQQWNGGSGPGRSGEARTILAVVWWTDWIGRKHVRIVARRGEFNNPARQNLLSRGARRPFQWQAYPENLYLLFAEGKEQLRGLCRCGAAGPPSDLGWMGNVCGPCHDRLEAGTLRRFPGPGGTILTGRSTAPGQLRFTSDGRVLVAVGESTTEITAWDLESGTCRKRAVAGEYVRSLGMLPDGRAVCVPWNGRVIVLDFEEVSVDLLCDLGSPNIYGAAISPDGTTLVAVDHDQVSLVNLETRRTVWATNIPHARGVRLPYTLEFAPDGRSLACEVQGPALRFLDAMTGSPLGPDLPFRHRVKAVAFRPNGSLLAAVDGEDGQFPGLLRLWRWPFRESVPVPVAHVRALAFSPDGRLLATSYHGAVTLWDAEELRSLVLFSWHTDWINGMAFSPDGQWLATGAEDYLIKLWPVASMLRGE
jgi:hypothetical protein